MSAMRKDEPVTTLTFSRISLQCDGSAFQHVGKDPYTGLNLFQPKIRTKITRATMPTHGHFETCIKSFQVLVVGPALKRICNSKINTITFSAFLALLNPDPQIQLLANQF
jgi:hypothetical protein